MDIFFSQSKLSFSFFVFFLGAFGPVVACSAAPSGLFLFAVSVQLPAVRQRGTWTR